MTNQQFLLAPGQRFQPMFALERGAERTADFRIGKGDRPARRSVFRSAACVMCGDSPVRIARVTCVQRAVGAPHHVDEVHAAILPSRVCAVQHSWVPNIWTMRRGMVKWMSALCYVGRCSGPAEREGALRFRRRYGIAECMPSTINS